MISLGILKLLTFNALKFMGSCDGNCTHFSYIFSALMSDSPWEYACQI